MSKLIPDKTTPKEKKYLAERYKKLMKSEAKPKLKEEKSKESETDIQTDSSQQRK